VSSVVEFAVMTALSMVDVGDGRLLASVDFEAGCCRSVCGVALRGGMDDSDEDMGEEEEVSLILV